MKFFVFVTIAFISFSTSNPAVVINKDQNLFQYYDPTPEQEILKEDKKFWYASGKDYLQKALNLEKEKKKHVAKNVIVFIGDGMGIPTITASRIYKGQRYFGKSGEDYQLAYEKFPNVGLVKTYNVDMQVPDSAGTATAIFTGVKTRYESVGVDVQAHRDNPDPVVFENSKLDGIMFWAQRANKATGIITTTRITDATPAASYAHIHNRNWECDSVIPDEFKPFVKDIGRQLVEEAPGKNFKVILGGGYQQLGHVKEDFTGNGKCIRKDGLNLTELWLSKHKNSKAAFVTNSEQLRNVDNVDYILGLFDPNNLPYELIRNKTKQGTPSLSEMTLKGLEVLKKNPNGFVLLVEAGCIDKGHHQNYARLALEEAAELDRTIELVLQQTGPDTLIIVTADHSHAMTINGYSQRGNDILGYGLNSKDSKPSLTLTYANGPGFAYHYTPKATSILGPWIDVRTDSNTLNDPHYRHLAAYELGDETHGGEDVGIFAVGPGSHLVRGVFEQNYIAHLISYAACIGPRSEMNPHCKCDHRT